MYDLEDSVTPNEKPHGRANILEVLNQDRAPNIHEQAVRINSVGSGFALADLTDILQGKHLDCIVVPKVDDASDLRFVTDVLRHMLPARHAPGASNPVKIVALIESARSVMNLSRICTGSPYLSGLVFAAEDFAFDLSLKPTPTLEEFTYARSAIVTAARAFNIPSVIDLVTTTLQGKQLGFDSENGRRFGFNGKQCIHPDQVPLVQRAFSPSEEELEWAVRVVICDAQADAQGRGAWTLDGKMIDVPVVRKAKATVARAKLCGLDTQHFYHKFRSEKPQ